MDEVTKVEVICTLFNYVFTNIMLIEQCFQIPSPDHSTQELDSDAPIDRTDNIVNKFSEQNIRLKIDCHRHLCNVWVESLDKNLCRYLRKVLEDE